MAGRKLERRPRRLQRYRHKPQRSYAPHSARHMRKRNRRFTLVS